MHAITFLLVFAAALVLYGLAMWKTGDVGLMPFHRVHSIRGSADVRHVGIIVCRVGLVLAALLLVALLLVRAEG